MKMEIPNVTKPVVSRTGETTLRERGLRSCFSRGARPARPARPPRLFTLAGRCVSLLCWLEGWGGARGPERSLGEEDAVLGGRWGVRSQENVNFIPSCQCGTSVQQGRGQTPPPPVRLLCAGRPAWPPGLRASSFLRLPALGLPPTVLLLKR